MDDSLVFFVSERFTCMCACVGVIFYALGEIAVSTMLGVLVSLKTSQLPWNRTMSNQCVFSRIRDCPCSAAALVVVKDKRRKTIQNASKRRKDDLHTNINDNETIYVHESCAKSYTSEQHIQKFLKRHEKNDDANSPQPKKTRRSVSTFNFEVHCLFCLCRSLHRRKGYSFD